MPRPGSPFLARFGGGQCDGDYNNSLTFHKETVSNLSAGTWVTFYMRRPYNILFDVEELVRNATSITIRGREPK